MDAAERPFVMGIEFPSGEHGARHSSAIVDAHRFEEGCETIPDFFPVFFPPE